MGGGSALLINSHRRGGGSALEFGCDGWFCDVLDGTLVLLVVMIIATAIIGCLRTCFFRKQKLPEQESKRTSEVAPEASCMPPTRTPPPSHHPVVIVMEYPPNYTENCQNLPPAYCTLKFNEQEKEPGVEM